VSDHPHTEAHATSKGVLAACVLICLIPAYGAFKWFFCRVEPASDQVVVVIAKTGKDLSPDRVIANDGEKGIRLEVLKPGARYFLNPFFYDWEEKPIAEVEPGKVGVLIRKFGRDPSPQAFEQKSFLVDQDSDEKGIVRQVLAPGRYPLNPYAYSLEVFPAVKVETGFVGVVTNLSGAEPEKKNEYLSHAGARGIQPDTLQPGTYFLNPFEKRVELVDVKTKRLELAAEKNDQAHGVVTFYSSDGFEIDVHLTTTWQVDATRAAEVFARTTTTGDASKLEEEIITKVLTPAIRGFARIEGSKFPAIDYIGGATRQHFEAVLLDNLKQACSPFAILVHEVLVNDIEPPEEIAGPIRDREIAKEELARNMNQIKQAQAEQSLARQTALVAQEKARVEAETKRLQQTIQAQNQQDVGLIDQEKLLLVAKTDLISAKAQAVAIVARGEAQANVIRAQNEAEAEPLRQSVTAFKSGAEYAAYEFARRVAPSIHGVFADPSGPFGQMFVESLKAAQEAARETAPKSGER
jgi:regulator of protease activity HflC (stomatin/prohibitin superfamily)